MKRLALTLSLIMFMGCAVRRPATLTLTTFPTPPSPLPAAVATTTNPLPPALDVQFSQHYHEVPEENQWNTGYFQHFRAFRDYVVGGLIPFMTQGATATSNGREVILTGKWSMELILAGKWKDKEGFTLVIQTQRDEEGGKAYTSHAKIEPLVDRADKQAQKIVKMSIALFADTIAAEQDKVTAAVQPP